MTEQPIPDSVDEIAERRGWFHLRDTGDRDAPNVGDVFHLRDRSKLFVRTLTMQAPNTFRTFEVHQVDADGNSVAAVMDARQLAAALRTDFDLQRGKSVELRLVPVASASAVTSSPGEVISVDTIQAVNQ
jgi:hypothetical protein